MDNPLFPQTAPPAEKKSFFKKAPVDVGPGIHDVLKHTSGIDSRVKLLEGRYNDLNRKLDLVDKNFLNEHRNNVKSLKLLDTEILEIKRQVNEIKNKIELIINDLKSCSRKEDFEALSKYVDLWDPINFVTRNEVERIIEDKFREKR